MGSATVTGSMAAPAGIRQYFRIPRKTKQIAEWDRNALRGLIYIYTDKAPFKHLLKK